MNTSPTIDKVVLQEIREAADNVVRELQDAGPTVSVAFSAKCMGIGKTKAHELIKDGRFPCRVLKLGARYRVITSDLLDVLGLADSQPVPGEPAA